jgi:hypothetical protein
VGERGSEAGKAQGGKPSAVTAAGIIDGDHDVLAALCERRGGAVLAYCRHISAPGLSAQAFARFRLDVAEATDPEALDPDATLLRATRYVAAAHVLQFVPLAPVPGLGLGRAWCPAVPQAIASRESGELSRWVAGASPCTFVAVAPAGRQRLVRSRPSGPSRRRLSRSCRRGSPRRS